MTACLTECRCYFKTVNVGIPAESQVAASDSQAFQGVAPPDTHRASGVSKFFSNIKSLPGWTLTILETAGNRVGRFFERIRFGTDKKGDYKIPEQLSAGSTEATGSKLEDTGHGQDLNIQKVEQDSQAEKLPSEPEIGNPNLETWQDVNVVFDNYSEEDLARYFSDRIGCVDPKDTSTLNHV